MTVGNGDPETGVGRKRHALTWPLRARFHHTTELRTGPLAKPGEYLGSADHRPSVWQRDETDP